MKKGHFAKIYDLFIFYFLFFFEFLNLNNKNVAINVLYKFDSYLYLVKMFKH